MSHISVQNLNKYYRLNGSSRSTLVSLLMGGVRENNGNEETVALSDISFEVPEGQCLGLIGRNGSGKSTLLRILAGIVAPSSGEVVVNGRLSTVLDIQSGLNPRMSGLQNIYLKGALYGLSKEEIDTDLE